MRPIALLVVAAFVVFLWMPGGAASDGSTELFIEVPEAVSLGEEFTVSAVLREHATGLPGHELVFTRGTLYGSIEIGRQITDADGRASVEVSISSGGRVVLSVSFGGEGVLRSSRAASALAVGGAAPPGPDFVSILFVGAVVAATIGVVWACYAFVLVQLWEIRHEGRRPAEGHGRNKTDR